MPDGFALAAVTAREDPRDAFVSNHYLDFASLPGGARIGTSSLRREAQLRERDPLLSILPLRGNVNTRLRKLDEGQYDAIVLAAAGLKRLGLRRPDRILSRSGREPSRRRARRAGAGMPRRSCRCHRSARAARRPRHDARDGRRARILARAVGKLPHAAGGACDLRPSRAVAPRAARKPRWGRGHARRSPRLVRRRAAADALGRALAEAFLARGAARLVAG